MNPVRRYIIYVDRRKALTVNIRFILERAVITQKGVTAVFNFSLDIQWFGVLNASYITTYCYVVI